MGDTIKDFLKRNYDFFQSIADDLTVCIRPEGIVDREPNEMWQGLLKNIPENLYELKVIMFNLEKSNKFMALEVPEEDLYAALKEFDERIVHSFPFFDETEVE